MEIPERLKPLIEKLIEQLISFEEAYGHIPKCQLVITEEYKQMIQMLGKQEARETNS